MDNYRSLTLAMKWKIFKDFLSKENALFPFYKCFGCGMPNGIRQDIKQRSVVNFLETLDNRTRGKIYTWIDMSIDWDQTENGFLYWETLDTKLRAYCAKLGLLYGMNEEGLIDIDKYRKNVYKKIYYKSYGE